jgi:outer membrane protein assembly factor BamB
MTQAAKALAGRFLLAEPLGATGLATVHRARDLSRGTEVAVKLLRSYFSRERELVRSFFRELERVQRLAHPNILPPLEMGWTDEDAWVALPYVAWPTLEQRLAEGPVSPALALGVLRQIAEALDYAHGQGVPHGDLKPSNLFLGPQGEVLVADFGMAALAEGAHPLVRSTLDTPHPSYTAPERIQGGAPDPASDLYSLGAVAYRMLTGESPFPAKGAAAVPARQLASDPLPPSQRNPSLPRGCDQVLGRALASHPLGRYRRAREFAAALEAPLAVGVAQPVTGIREGRVPAPQAQTALPAGVDGSDALATRQAEVFCPACGCANPPGDLYCSACWARLADRPLPSREEAEQVRRRIVRDLRLGRALRWGLAGLVAAGIAFLAFTWFYAPSVPRATSLASSASGAGATAMYGLDLARTSATAQGPALRGVVAWRFKTGAPLLASPAAVGGVVYQPTGDRRVVALDVRDGRLLWEHPTSGPVDSSPALADGLLYYGQRDGKVVALRQETGEVAWAYGAGGPVMGSPAVDRGVVYIGAGDGVLYALDAKTGQKLWDFQANGWVAPSVPLNQEVVVVPTSSGEVYIVNVKTGRERLFFDVVNTVPSTPALAPDRVFIPTTSGRLVAVDWRKREYPLERTALWWHFHLWVWGIVDRPPAQKGFLWSRDLARRTSMSSPALLGDTLYVAAAAGRLYALDATRGRTRWEYALGATSYSSPVVAGPAVYLGAEDGSVHAVDRETGARLWTTTVGGSIATRPVVAGDTLYAASADGTLYAIR